jgi:hypothetical protein
MQAAMDYRKVKAAAVKAKAEAAAVSANAGWAEGKKLAGMKKSDAAANAAIKNGAVAAPTTTAKPSSAGGAAAGGIDGAASDNSSLSETTTVEEAPSCVVPADIVRAQAAAHRAMKEVKQAEAEVRRALRLNPQSDGDDPEHVSSVAGAGA